jgi:hypothetical protein
MFDCYGLEVLELRIIDVIRDCANPALSLQQQQQLVDNPPDRWWGAEGELRAQQSLRMAST